MHPASSPDGFPSGAPPGRGAGFNPANRFEAQHLEFEPGAFLDDDGQPLPLRTQFFRDDTQTIIAWNDSPDIPFRAGVSPYRGCEHGCAYCFARPFHEYLGFSAGLDFESKIMVKMRAAELLRAALSKKSWQPQPIAMSGVTDVYQPVERRLGLTRACLVVLAEQIKALFSAAHKRAGFRGRQTGMDSTAELSTAAFRVRSDQLSLFGD